MTNERLTGYQILSWQMINTGKGMERRSGTRRVDETIVDTRCGEIWVTDDDTVPDGLWYYLGTMDDRRDDEYVQGDVELVVK